MVTESYITRYVYVYEPLGFQEYEYINLAVSVSISVAYVCNSDNAIPKAL